MSRNVFWVPLRDEVLTDLKIGRDGQFRERFLFTPNPTKRALSAAERTQPMKVKLLHAVPKGRDKEFYKRRAEHNAKVLGIAPEKASFNWGIQAPKEAGHPIPNVVFNKEERAKQRREARSNPPEYTKGGSQAAHARYKVKKAGFD